jgi:uncharacterized surface protein with fasciclin (FAS1) repeats
MKRLRLIKICLATLIATSFITSCNQDLPDAVPITTTFNSLTIGNFLNTDTAYTLFNAAVKASPGISALLSDSSATTSYTLFAPNNNAFRAIGITSTAAAATLGGIVPYLIDPGHEFLFTDFPTTFPNIQLPTLQTIGILPIPGTTTFPFRLTNFPSRRGNQAWLNATPITSSDIHYRNGVVHTISGIIIPPSKTLKDTIYADPQLTLFAALITRADQATVSANLVAALSNPGANLTVFAPNNTAIKAFINAASLGAVPIAAPDAVFIGFINSNFPADNAQGIVLYHILQSGVRAFSVNFAPTPTLYKTLLNNGIAAHPGVNVQSIFAANGLAVTSIKVIGLGTLPPGGAPFSGPAATSTAFDRIAVNGVVHIIDRVLLPQ